MNENGRRKQDQGRLRYGRYKWVALRQWSLPKTQRGRAETRWGGSRLLWMFPPGLVCLSDEDPRHHPTYTQWKKKKVAERTRLLNGE